MKFALASYGTRGDVEPCTAVGRELQRRGHDVRLAVPPNLVALVESAGLAAAAYGPDQQDGFWDTDFLGKFWNFREVRRRWREAQDMLVQSWADMSATLTSLSEGADLVFTGPGFPGVAADVAEHLDLSLATMHYFPMRPNGQLYPGLPAPLVRSAMTALDWTMAGDEEGRGQPAAGIRAAEGQGSRSATDGRPRRTGDPGLRRGVLPRTGRRMGEMERPAALCRHADHGADDGRRRRGRLVDRRGNTPICFGFGSTAVDSPADTITMIGDACAQLGERALVCSGKTDFTGVPQFDHVKVVGVVNYAAVFPACRAVVHHSGAGTTAAGLRAGVPTLSLWSMSDQKIWAGQIDRLHVGTARPFSSTTRETLIADLRRILAPDYVARARELSSRMTKPAESVDRAVDLLENFAHTRRFG